MKIEFLQRSPENSRLILIFSGWSTAPGMYADAAMKGWDLAVVHDYSDLTPVTSMLDEYYTVYLFAWSLGVKIAEETLPADRITAAFAINGTLDPVDDRHGIPEAIYDGTADGLSPQTLRKFRRRMMPDSETFQRFFGNNDDTDDIETLRESLRGIKKFARSHPSGVSAGLPWLRAYIGQDDRIFPASNMRRSWERLADTEIIETAGAHYLPFEAIVGSVIADTDTVSRKFAKASISYDTNAIAQQAAAVRLAAMLAATQPKKGGKVLEIGCGTGLFTREYGQLLAPAEATFVDIAPTGPFGIAPEENYHKADAEVWMEHCDDTFDAILSASAIQWFADIPRFMRLCRRHLNPEGVVAISTFLPGNMRELDRLRPSPIIYPRREALEAMMRENFTETRIESEEICVEFQSAREMMMHLKHTGVGGSSASARRGIGALSQINRLTYTPVYMTGKAPREDEGADVSGTD